MPDRTLRVAVVTGGHSFDVPNFHNLFRSMPKEMEITIQHMEDFASSSKEVRQAYDVVLFYIMLMAGPDDDKLPWYAGKPRAALEDLGKTRQGILVLHHALLAYPDWPDWSKIVGIWNRKFGYHIGQSLRVRVHTPPHPIVWGLESWDMVDETYTMDDAGPDSNTLLTVDHPNSMKTIAWTRQYKESRVFCFQSGHDNATWVNANFREVLKRGIQWCGGTL